MDDRELLKRYVDLEDQAAFAELVGRHGPWIYASACRQLGDTYLAEDTTQAVFLLLSRRARRLAGYANLAGWLFLTLRYCIKEARRQRSRRQRHEREVASMRKEGSALEGEWEQVAPVLDGAIGRLGKADRELLLLRYYRRMSIAEVAGLLGISEEAAKKRLQRATLRLREVLEARGVAVEAAALSGAMLAHAGGELPGSVAEALLRGLGGEGSGMPGAIAKGATVMMVLGKAKVTAGVITLAAVVVSVSGWAVIAATATPPAPVAATQPGQPTAVRTFEIQGAVPRAGTYYQGERSYSLLQALASAGVDLGNAAGQMAEVVRPAAAGSAETRYRYLVRDLTDGSVDFFVHPGDRVVLHPRGAKPEGAEPATQLGWGEFFMTGVERSGTYSYPAQLPRMRFKQALVSGGYKPREGDWLTVCRRTADGGVERFAWPVDEVIRGDKPEFVVRDGDVLMVGAEAGESPRRVAPGRVAE